MSRLRTHYDNLKVARDAPPEVISAAYRSLSKKYHPDNNPGNPGAARIMAILNAAHEVLSDPTKRKLHDEWIAEMEAKRTTKESRYAEEKKADSAPTGSKPTPVRPRRRDSYAEFGYRLGRHVGNNKGAYIYFALLIIVILLSYIPNARGPAAPPLQPSPAAERRPGGPTQLVNAPNYTTPKVVSIPRSKTGYVKGYPRKATGGYCSVTVDNTRNDHDVFVKLFSLRVKRTPVRYFVILAREKFTLKGISAGNYDVRYKDLITKRLARTEPFNLNETHESEGVRYSHMTLTLYKVINGNMKTFVISDAEFE